MNVTKLLFPILVYVFSTDVLALDSTSFVDGFTKKENVEPFDEIWSRFGSMPTYLVQTDDLEFWGMSRDGRGVAYYSFSLGGEAQGWPLTRWKGEAASSVVEGFYQLYGDPKIGAEYGYRQGFSGESSGCFVDTPLRYGDGDEDGTDELVLFIGLAGIYTDIILFSPELGETRFGARLFMHDHLYAEPYPSSRYQFTSPYYVNKGYRAAVRAYSKLYFGDFNGDNVRDILVWRKRFESNLKDNPTPGFHRTDEIRQHYQLVGGVYKRQPTPADQIQAWLSEHNLTWPEGYPRLSECPGEEGELIKELHDPLLNDPEVVP